MNPGEKQGAPALPRPVEPATRDAAAPPLVMALENKPDFETALERVEAWFAGEMIGRPPVRFGLHNAEYEHVSALSGRWPDLKSRWFDAEYQVDRFLAEIGSNMFLGETFPVYWPNLGPNVYAAFFGCDLEYGEITSWIKHCVHAPEDMARLKFSRRNPYFLKIEELTRVALEKCAHKALVGYTDLHGSLDCAADWRDPQNLCMDLIDAPELVHELVNLADAHFFEVFDHFDATLKAHGQLSVTWMGIPSRGRMHISSSDFTTMIAPAAFDEFYLPSLRAEAAHMTHTIHHLDGKGCARHLDRILELPDVHAIQWVQGVGDDRPILQWLPLIRKIQAAGKGVVLDLQLDELEPFIDSMRPEGIFLCLEAPANSQGDILKRLERWR
jgi:hypothetical protein